MWHVCIRVHEHTDVEEHTGAHMHAHLYIQYLIWGCVSYGFLESGTIFTMNVKIKSVLLEKNTTYCIMFFMSEPNIY